MNDQTVRRANQLTTTFLDTLGALLIAAGVGWALWVTIAPAAGLAAAGIVVLLFSLLAQRQATPKAEKVAEPDPKPLPGPSDPGTVHVMGR